MKRKGYASEPAAFILDDRGRVVYTLHTAIELESPVLDVPYYSQWGEGADKRPGDCGPAALASVIAYMTNARPTVDEVAAACGQSERAPGWSYTNHVQLRNGARRYGVTLETRSPYTERNGKPRLSLDLLRERVDVGMPSIALIHYGVLRDETNDVEGVIHNQDQAYDRGHWVTFVGYDDDHVYIHDSDFWNPRTQDGDTRAVPVAAFEAALTTVAPGCSVGEQGLVVKAV